MRESDSNLTQLITNSVGEKIASGQYESGRTLPAETEISKEHNVDLEVVRDALGILVGKGLVSSHPRQRMHVLEKSQWSILDKDVLGWLLKSAVSNSLLLDFAYLRKAVEPDAAALAARRHNIEMIEPIAAALERMRVATQNAGRTDLLESDIAFHVAILEATGNRLFAQFSRVTEAALRHSISFTNWYSDGSISKLDSHAKVLDAIEHRQPKVARKRLRSIINKSIKTIESRRREFD